MLRWNELQHVPCTFGKRNQALVGHIPLVFIVADDACVGQRLLGKRASAVVGGVWHGALYVSRLHIALRGGQGMPFVVNGWKQGDADGLPFVGLRVRMMTRCRESVNGKVFDSRDAPLPIVR